MRRNKRVPGFKLLMCAVIMVVGGSRVTVFAGGEETTITGMAVLVQGRGLTVIDFLYEYPLQIFSVILAVAFATMLGFWKYVRTQRQLYAEIEKRNQLYELMNEHFFEYDHNTRELIMNSPLTNDPTDKVAKYDLSGLNMDVEQPGKLFFKTIRSGQDGSFEIRDLCSDGEYHWLRIIQKNFYDSQKRLKCTLGSVEIIDEVKRKIHDLVMQAQRDGLTGLYNAQTFRFMVEKALNSHQEGSLSALLLLDIDHFKKINDSFGHMHGDQAICWLADKLNAWFGPQCLLGRYGGDEFMIFLPRIDDKEQLAQECERLCNSVRRHAEDVKGGVTISLGAVYYSEPDEYDELFQNADRALYQAKAAGRNRYAVLCQADIKRDSRNHCDVAAKWLDDTAYQAILKETHMIAFEFDLKNRIQHVSPFIGEFLAGNYDGRLLSDVMVQDDVIYHEDRDKSIKFREQINSGQDGEMVLRLKTPEGDYRWFRMAITCLDRNGDRQIMAGVLEDIDTRMQYQEVLRLRAEIDTVSGIYNKQTFFERTHHVIREAEEPLFLIWFDIERFKLINSLYGSNEGNKVLMRIGDILRESAKGKETYGRLGNDVFCMCVNRNRRDTVSLVNTIVQKLRDYPLDFRFFLPTGIIEIEPGCGESMDVLCDKAAVAQKEIKGDYLRNYAFYMPFMGEKLNRQHELISSMERALEQHQFQAYFQPQFDMRNGRIIGAETLARWEHPVLGMISPIEFIPLFEHNGFIVELDKYIWEIACRAIRRWLDSGIRPAPLSVNVSRIHLYDKELCSSIISLCDRFSIPHSLLHLEITESAYTEQPQDLFPIMEMLQQAGFVFAMDDFGSGYSSLNILKDIPVDIVKFDLRFLEKARKGEEVGQSILKNTIQLMNELNLSVLAEGVETGRQVSFLKDMNCFYAQGYYYARPMPLEEFEKLLREQDSMMRLEGKQG